MSKPPAKTPTNVPPRRKGGPPPRGGALPPRRPPKNKPAKRRPPRRSRWLTLGFPTLAVAVIAVVVALLVSGGGGGSVPSAVDYKFHGTPVYGKLGPERVPLEVGSPLAPANRGLSGKTIDGIQCNTTEQLAYHHHIHLAIFVDGQPRSVPLGVGMVPPAIVQKTPKGPFAQGSQKCLYWLHVHAGDGIVHIESPVARTFVLGQFFGVWGQKLTSTQVGPAKGKVTVTVNGKPWHASPTEIPLKEHTQVVINVGKPIVKPPPISWKGTGL